MGYANSPLDLLLGFILSLVILFGFSSKAQGVQVHVLLGF